MEVPTTQKEKIKVEEEVKEAVLLDFSNTFKSGTRGFKKKKKPIAAEDNIIKDENN